MGKIPRKDRPHWPHVNVGGQGQGGGAEKIGRRGRILSGANEKGEPKGRKLLRLDKRDYRLKRL